MIRPRFLSPEDRAALVDLAQAGSVEHRVARRAHALVLLDDGLSCETIAKVLLVDDDTAVQVFFCKFREGDFSVVVITLSG
jgi:hypothetical protein